MKKITALILVAALAASFMIVLNSVSAETEDTTAAVTEKFSVTAWGGYINSQSSEITVPEGTVVTVSLDETKWSGHTFDCWVCDDETMIPYKTFKVLVERNTAFYPTFTGLTGEFGEWTVYKKGTYCTDYTIKVREDTAKGLKEFTSEKSYVHNYEYTSDGDETHTGRCTKCPSVSEPGSHYWNDGIVTKEATCGEEGVKTFTCKTCGAVKTETIAKSDYHSWGSAYTVDTEPGSSSPGKRHLTCRVCGTAGESTDYIVATLPTTGNVQHFTYECTSGYSSQSRIEEHYISDSAYLYTVQRGDVNYKFSLLWYNGGENSPVYIKGYNKTGTSSLYGNDENGHYAIFSYVDSKEEFVNLIDYLGAYTYDNGRMASNFMNLYGYPAYETLYNEGNADKLTLINSDYTLDGWPNKVSQYTYPFSSSYTHTYYVDMSNNVCVKLYHGSETYQITFETLETFPAAEPDKTKITEYRYYVLDGSYNGDDMSYFGITDSSSEAKYRTATAYDRTSKGEKFAYWEQLDLRTGVWSKLSTSNPHTPGVNDVTIIRAIYEPILCHIKVIGGHYTVNGVNYTEGDVAYGTGITLEHDPLSVPEGKEYYTFADASGESVSYTFICEADGTYTAQYKETEYYLSAYAENGTILKDGTTEYSGEWFTAKTVVSLTTKCNDETQYPYFLGWYTVDGGTLLCESKDYTVTVPIGGIDIKAIWSSSEILPHTNWYTIGTENCLLRVVSGPEKIAVSSIRISDENYVSVIENPAYGRELEKWILTETGGNTAINSGSAGGGFYISGSSGGKGDSYPANMTVSGIFKTYCIHLCSTCGKCTEETCSYTEKCTCETKEKAVTFTNNGPLTGFVPGEGEAEGITTVVCTIDLTASTESTYVKSIVKATEGYKIKALYEISLSDSTGSKYSLLGTATATLTVGTEYAKAIKDGKMLLAHITDTGVDYYGVGYKDITTDETAGTVTFKTDGFSPFAVVESESFTVTYRLNGETYGTVESYTYGSSVDLATNIENATAWVSEDVAVGEDGKFTMPQKNVTFTALTVRNAIFLDGDGSVLESISYKFGESVVPTSKTPTKAEDEANIYEFSGWKDFTADMTMGDVDVTFTPVFDSTLRQYDYTVKYQDTDGNKIADDITKSAGYGTSVEAELIEITGYTVSSPGEKLTVGSVEADNVIICKYTANSYSITYTVNGEKVHEDTAVYKTEETAYTYSVTGYDVSDWTSEDVDIDNGKFIVPAKNVTLTATLTPHTHYAIFLNGDGSELDKVQYKFGESIVSSTKTPTKAEDEANTYEFSGWKDFTADMTMGDADVTFTPMFDSTLRQYDYTVKYQDTDGNKIADDITKSAGYGTSVEAELIEITGYTVSSPGEKLTVGSVEADNVIICKYTANSYSITYTVNGEKVHEDTAVYKTEETAYTYSVTGYDVSDWTSEDVDIDNGKFIVPAKNVTLTATLTPHTHYAIFLNGDGSELDKVQYKFGESIVVTEKKATKAEDTHYTYTFSKWDGLTADTVMVDEDMTFESVFSKTLILNENEKDNSINVSSGSEGALFTSDQIQLIKNKALSGTVMNVMVDDFRITFNDKALNNLIINESALCIGNIKEADVKLINNKAPGNDPSYYRITFGDNKNFGEDGIVTIKIPFILKKDYDIKNVNLYYIDSEYESIAFEYSDNYLIFNTNHFSDYAVAYNAESPETSPGDSSTVLIVAVIAVIAVIAIAGFFIIQKKKSV